MEADIEIGQFEDDSIGEGGVITSGGMGPCIAVAIYDPKSGVAHMIHESNASSNDNLEPFIESIVENATKEKMTVYVCGGAFCSLDDEATMKSMMEDRDYVEEIISKSFNNSQVSIMWTKDDHHACCYLDSSDGTFTRDEYGIPR